MRYHKCLMGTIRWHFLHTIWLAILVISWHTATFQEKTHTHTHTRYEITCNDIIPYHIHKPRLTVTVAWLPYRMRRWARRFLLLVCQEMSLCYQYQLDRCCRTLWFTVAWLPTLECITFIPCCWKHQDPGRRMKECQQVYFIIPPEHQVHTLQERYAADGFYCSHKGNTISTFVVSAQLVTVSITCVVMYCGTVQCHAHEMRYVQ